MPSDTELLDFLESCREIKIKRLSDKSCLLLLDNYDVSECSTLRDAIDDQIRQVHLRARERYTFPVNDEGNKVVVVRGRSCFNCGHSEKTIGEFPCCQCDSNYSKWEARG